MSNAFVTNKNTVLSRTAIDTVILVCGVDALSSYMLVRTNRLGKIEPADCRFWYHANAVEGMSVEASTLDMPITVARQGCIEFNGWSLTENLPVFLGLYGQPTQTLPRQAVFQKMIGVATSPTRISISFQPAIFLAA